VLCIAVSKETRLDVTAWVYANQVEYLQGRDEFDRGLFHWEADFLDFVGLRPGGRVLVGAVGGGREAFFLGQLGYGVVAFEPSGLIVGAVQATRKQPGVTVVRASYADLLAALDGSEGPLARVRTEAFDAIILGWTSLSNLVSEPVPADLLQAVRHMQPKPAPVLVSVISSPDSRDPSPPWWSLRRHLDAFVEPGLDFSRKIGFHRGFRRSDLERLAEQTGYTLAKFGYEWGSYSYAFFMPEEALGG
jgi:hypothetical protein